MTPFTLAELEDIHEVLVQSQSNVQLLVARRINEIKAAAGSDKRDWDLWCTHLGLTPGDFGKIFTIRGSTYKAIGVNPTKRKYAIKAERLPDGKIFGVPASCVR
jgi:hypothetical protein